MEIQTKTKAAALAALALSSKLAFADPSAQLIAKLSSDFEDNTGRVAVEEPVLTTIGKVSNKGFYAQGLINTDLSRGKIERKNIDLGYATSVGPVRLRAGAAHININGLDPVYRTDLEARVGNETGDIGFIHHNIYNNNVDRLGQVFGLNGSYKIGELDSSNVSLTADVKTIEDFEKRDDGLTNAGLGVKFTSKQRNWNIAAKGRYDFENNEPGVQVSATHTEPVQLVTKFFQLVKQGFRP